ncbi:ATP-binding protein [Candidatus Palauibacter sp.]|uniref:ATP-binding protein n=1 Tax=Candidatus Palauibacter sp. TaxID=3101350 RepID=UPI003B5A98DF
MVPDLRSVSNYIPRVADRELARRLASAGAVVIEGPRVCGKTTTARQAASSEVLIDADPSVDEAMAVDPRLLLEGPEPRLIDEWQLEPAIWNYIRRAVDDRPGRGHFILTGSAVPPDDITRHTGAGRMSRLRLRPMSLFELGGTKDYLPRKPAGGRVSLKRLLRGEAAPSLKHELSLDDIAELLCVGGWPGHLRAPSVEDAMVANRDYLDEICRTDIRRVDGIARDPERVRRFLSSIARNTATCATVATMAGDAGGSDASLSRESAHSYLGALERLMVVEHQPPWAPHLRSRSRLRNTPKRHFADPSLAVAALGAGPEHLLRDLHWFGFLFESMAVRDLRVYAQDNRASVYHYRDNTDLEVDAIVDGGPNRWAAFEIKLGAGRIEEAAQTLLKFADRVDTERTGQPAALGVITGSPYGYHRPDGVSVIPVGSLGP